MRNCFGSECPSYMGSCGGLYEGGHGVASNSVARGSIIKSNVIMMEIIISYIIKTWAFLMKLSLLWLTSLLVALCDVTHLFGCFVGLLLEFSQLKHFLASSFHLVMDSFKISDFLV
jgi:hypothetical protein